MPRRPVTPGPAPLAMPAVDPVPARRTPRWRWAFRGTFGLLLVLGFTVGFVAGSPKPAPATKPVAVAAAMPAKPDSVPPPEPKSEPKARPVEKKAAEVKASEPDPPEPKTVPEPPIRKPEPKPEPKPELKKSPPPSAGEVAFARVSAVFKDKCLNCHGGAEAKGGLDLRSAKSAIAGGDSGEAVKPGDPDNSLLWQSVRDGTMPPKGKPQLTAAEKKLIQDWIAGGAK